MPGAGPSLAFAMPRSFGVTGSPATPRGRDWKVPDSSRLRDVVPREDSLLARLPAAAGAVSIAERDPDVPLQDVRDALVVIGDYVQE
jgi:hypothetical protein